MILTDVNILIYAHDINFKHHQEIKIWFEEKLTSADSLYLSWQAITGFLRITTNPKLFPNPLAVEKSVEKMNRWLERPNVSILVETEKHWATFNRLIIENNLRGGKIMDAHIAALAIEHGVTLVTTDRDFLTFKGLRTLNPLDL